MTHQVKHIYPYYEVQRVKFISLYDLLAIVKSNKTILLSRPHIDSYLFFMWIGFILTNCFILTNRYAFIYYGLMGSHNLMGYLRLFTQLHILSK